MTAREVGAAIGVSERTVRRWIDAGALPATKHGGAFSIDLEAARAVFRQSRPGRSLERSIEVAELRGRYLEVRDRLTEAERLLALERAKSARLEAILYPPARPSA